MDNINDKLSPYSHELQLVVDVLKQKLPRPSYSPSTTIETIMYEEGKQAVIQHLEQLLIQIEQQSKDVLTKSSKTS
mgnify:CR=1 FL=1